MKKLDVLYRGKAKRLYQTTDEAVLWVEYLDQVTALNGLKKESMSGKGALNNQITSLIFNHLHEKGQQTHFLKQLSETEQLVRRVDIIPLEVVLRNIAAGSFSKRFDIAEGTELSFPIIEFYYKSDELNDPFINDEQAVYLNVTTHDELAIIRKLTQTINRELINLFQSINIRLIDFKLEFGRTEDGRVILADEISPDTCRLWDMDTNTRLDKDIYRRQMGDVRVVYQIVLNRLKTLLKKENNS